MLSLSTSRPDRLRLLTEFILSAFRKQFGLWYDIAESDGATDLINKATLTDGSTYFYVHFDKANGVDRQTFIMTGEFGYLRMIATVSEDSRRVISAADIRNVANSATQSFLHADFSETAFGEISLLSLEIAKVPGSAEASLLIDSIGSRLHGNVVACPEYQGLIADDANYKVEKTDDLEWKQIDLNAPVAVEVVRDVFAEFTTNPRDFRADQWNRLECLPSVQADYGVILLRVRARAF